MGHALTRMGDGKVLDFVATDGSWRLWNYDPTQKDILPGNPVQQGKWASIDAGHVLVKMADGKVLDFVAGDGSWRLWNYNATEKDILPGNPVQQGKWASIAAGHTLIPMADGKVLDFVAANGSWRLWNYDATQKDILPGNPVQQGKWASISGGQTLIPMADGKVLDLAGDGSWRLWNYNAMQKDIFPGNPVQQGKWASITSQGSSEPAPPSILQWQTDPINFDGPAPVTGNAYLTLRPDGSYTYRGHFNTTPPAVPGITWSTENAWLVVDNQGYAFSFAHSGSVENPIIGSIDTDDWAENSTNKELAARWQYMGGARYFTHSNTGVDLGTTIQGLIDDAKQAVGDIEQVVAIVGPLVALAA